MNKKQNILIAGATGLVGKNCVEHFLNKGYGIIVLTQNKERAKENFGNKAAYLNWKELEEKERVHPPIDIIINLAGANIGEKRWTNTYKEQLIDSRINSIQALISLINKLKIKPKQWIQASAIGYYGYEQNKPMGEESKQGEGFLAELVNRWERTLLNANLQHTKISILRLGVVLFNKGGLLPQLTQTAKLKFIACPGNGKNMLSWIHINDLINIMDFIIEKKLNGTMNATSPFPIQMMHACEKIKTHRNAWMILKAPKQILYLLLGKEKANELALASQNSLPNKIINAGYQFQYPLFENCL